MISLKLRCVPEDFIVAEVTSHQPSGGPFALYELRKESIDTLDALQHIQRSWNLAPKQLNHAGLKDRHASTSQFVTIRNGPDADFSHDLFELQYLGQTDRPADAADIQQNRFEITARDLSDADSEQLLAEAKRVKVTGFVNYFDTQRFGSLGESQEFIARHWCMKDYERALWLALAEHNDHDSPAEREQKQILRDHWNDWDKCKQRLERSHRRSVVTYLVDHPDKYRKAFALVNMQLRGLYLSAFQSAVWNRMVAAALNDSGTVDADVIQVGDAELPLLSPWHRLPTGLQQLPLPSVRSKNLTPQVRELCHQALQPYDMTLRQMKVHFPRDRWFSRAVRQVVVVPSDLSAEVDDDELHHGRSKVTLFFSLPPGSYATMLIKALTASGSIASGAAESFE